MWYGTKQRDPQYNQSAWYYDAGNLPVSAHYISTDTVLYLIQRLPCSVQSGIHTDTTNFLYQTFIMSSTNW